MYAAPHSRLRRNQRKFPAHGVPAAATRNGIKDGVHFALLAMQTSTASKTLFHVPSTLTTEVRMIKGVGPQRAELLAKREIHTLDDLLNYLPFRYEDRIRFSEYQRIATRQYLHHSRASPERPSRARHARPRRHLPFAGARRHWLAPLQIFSRRLSGRPPQARPNADPSRQSGNRQTPSCAP